MTKGSLKNQIVKKVSKWPLEKKISAIFSVLLIVSLFFNWYNDTDIFHTGETYNALNGPLYLAGYTILTLAILNLAISFEKIKLFGYAVNNKNRGKLQMFLGFLNLYFLILINSAYFHPQFGLNLLAKKAGICSMLALIATVMIAIGGYLTFRKGLIETEGEIEQKIIPKKQSIPEIQETSQDRQIGNLQKPSVYALNVNAQTAEQNNLAKNSKTYETIKMLMQKDTKTPEQRRKEREASTLSNVFSNNSGIAFDKLRRNAGLIENGKKANQTNNKNDLLRNAMKKKSSTVSSGNSVKKPQMYRTDL